MKTQKVAIHVRPIWALGKGHSAHRSGSGVHKSRRTRRLRTRSAQNRRAVGDGI